MTMNRENEEQRPVSQTICGALQKEPNCKCLVLSVLIYGCLAAVTWCRCANVTKVVINFSRYPIKSTKHVSPCDDGYIYIPVAFMGMLYLVYLVECYHSPIRIDLLHAESQDGVLSKLCQLRSAQPTIWWKAVSYHYVRRKRQITRYRNGDNYTTTQVYYERINTHAATSFYYYDYCGVKDISKELVLEPKIPITKITLTKGFAFSNMRSATEFEEARSRFFAEQELRDDYMEMKEGLDLGYNPNPTTLVAVLGTPWFTNRYVYWCLSALLLSWPLRVIIEYKTQYADYQITKLFGVNYDTPTGSEPIHTSMSQLSHPGSYMLAPSYSEALLMDPAPSDRRTLEQQEALAQEIVPSYSEALLYERAEQGILPNEETTAHSSNENSNSQYGSIPPDCPCSCHTIDSAVETRQLEDAPLQPREDETSNEIESQAQPGTSDAFSSVSCAFVTQPEMSRCGNCGDCTIDMQRTNCEVARGGLMRGMGPASSTLDLRRIVRKERLNGAIPRDMSEPNLRSHAETVQAATRFLRMNGESLRNILENEQEARFDGEEAGQSTSENKFGGQDVRGKFRLSLSSLNESNCASSETVDASRGAIPKRTVLRSRVISNPMSNEVCQRLPDSKTYFCLKSILKQNKRRYTLITARELQQFSDREASDQEESFNRYSYHEGYTPCANATVTRNSASGRRLDAVSHSGENLDSGQDRKQFFESSIPGRNDATTASMKRGSTRTLIFASPIQEVCPGDPFGGKDVVQARREVNSSPTDETPTHTVLSHLGRSRQKIQDFRKQRCVDAVPHNSFARTHEPRYPYQHTFAASTNDVDVVDVVQHEHPTMRVYQNGISFPPYEGANSPRTAKAGDRNEPATDRTFPRISGGQDRAELTRSFTERRTKPVRNEPLLRRSFTGRVDDYRAENGKRMNLNMETSL